MVHSRMLMLEAGSAKTRGRPTDLPYSPGPLHQPVIANLLKAPDNVPKTKDDIQIYNSVSSACGPYTTRLEAITITVTSHLLTFV